MIEAVITFAILLAAFEFVIISMIAPRWRLRLLGSSGARGVLHFGMLTLNLIVHWGTVTGTMAATGAFVVSLATVGLARIIYGEITNDIRTRRGLVGFSNAELMR
jgi:hypothetical protein